MAATETARLAVLIDADNASASVVKELLEEVACFVALCPSSRLRDARTLTKSLVVRRC